MYLGFRIGQEVTWNVGKIVATGFVQKQTAGAKKLGLVTVECDNGERFALHPSTLHAIVDCAVDATAAEKAIRKVQESVYLPENRTRQFTQNTLFSHPE